MHIYSAIMIFICFKEIYSWNSAINFMFLSTLLPCYCFSYNFNIMKRSSNESLLNSTTNIDNIKEPNVTTLANTNVSYITTESTATPNHAILTELAANNKINITSHTLLPKTKDENGLLTTLPTYSNETVLMTTEVPEILSTNNNISVKENINFTTLTPTTINITFVPTTLPTNSTIEDSSGLYPFHYVLIVFAVIAIILLLAYGIYHMYRKEQVRRLRLQLMPVYNFDPTESDDWENNLLEEEFTLRSRDKEKNIVVTAEAVIDVGESLRQPHQSDPCEPITQL